MNIQTTLEKKDLQKILGLGLGSMFSQPIDSVEIKSFNRNDQGELTNLSVDVKFAEPPIQTVEYPPVGEVIVNEPTSD